MQWNIERKPLSFLKENPKNPRRLTQVQGEGLKKSIEKFGECQPIICQPDGFIIGGHQRYKILKKLKRREVDVYIPATSLSTKDAEELSLRLNKNQGEWDYDILANEWDINLLLESGFDPDELHIDVLEETSEEDEVVPPLPKDPRTKDGDFYQLGNHFLLCGDSTRADHVEKLLDSNIPHLMVTDPPYGVNYDPEWRERAGKGARAKGKVKNDGISSWKESWSLFPGEVAYIWHAAWFSHIVAQDLIDCGFEIKSQIIWNKQHFAIGRGNYHWKHEPCWYMVKKDASHHWQNSRKEHTVWEIANLNCMGKSKDEDTRTDHSTQKPLECMSRPIINNSKVMESVYDPFLGSGTTLIACERLKRKCFGIEIDPSYCDIIIDRWVNHRLRNKLDSTVKVNDKKIKWETLASS